MTFDQLRKIEKEYSNWLSKQGVIETKIQKTTEGSFALWLYYKELSIKKKKEIATELGDIPLKFTQK